MSLRRDPVTVHVPASSANLGPAFDCAGLALDIWDTYSATVTTERGVQVQSKGEGAGALPTDCSHLVALAMRHAFDAFGERPAGFTVTCTNRIPHARGLGSSAAAIIGGVVLARALLHDSATISNVDVLRIALELESHPDNLSAALAGGFTVAWLGENPGYLQTSIDPRVHVTLCIPEHPLATVTARTLLPETVPQVDAVHNIARAALLYAALTAQPDMLLEATDDRLHQRQRASIYPESLALVDALRAAGIPAAISGAGPSVLTFAAPEQIAPFAQSWQVQATSVPATGAWVEN